MSLYVAVVGDAGVGYATQTAAWGAWSVVAANEPISVATEALVLSGLTSHVLVLSPRTHAAAAHVIAATVAAVRPHVPVRVDVSTLSTWALARLVDIARETPGVPNTVHAVLARSLNECAWGAWLPSVSGLAEPPPSLWQHVQSWLPGGLGYLAVGGDHGWVLRLPLQSSRGLHPVASGETDRRGPRFDAGRPGVLCQSTRELSEPVIKALFDLGVTRRPQVTDPQGSPETTWGTPRAVEFILVAPTPAPSSLAVCPTCGDAVHAAACPFCRAVPTADLSGGLDQGVQP